VGGGGRGARTGVLPRMASTVWVGGWVSEWVDGLVEV
jgi:hypothetical protein